MSSVSYENKASEMYEVAMENVKQDIDKAWEYSEELAILIGKVEDEDLRDQLDEKLSAIMNTLEKV